LEKAEKYMRRVLTLARKGEGKVSPNPMVGALVVKDGRVVGEGYHHAAGKPHAEILAMEAAGEMAAGADLYLNLEPCSHWGRTPPCIDAIIKNRIARVFVGLIDPNPRVAGLGIKTLRDNGIEVDVGILENECRQLNEVFFKYITLKIPFVIMKAAATLDGRMATSSNDSRWVTGEPARKFVHRLRSRHDAILVGVNTVIADDPQLNCRLPGKHRQPLRIVLDSKLRIPLSSQLVKTCKEMGVLIATTEEADENKLKKLEQAGVEVARLEAARGQVALVKLLEYLGEREVTSLMIEGGSEVFTSALAEKIVDKVYLFYAPKILGGRDSIPMVGGENPRYMSEALTFHDLKLKKLGEDILLTGYPEYKN
jgi:diaminohydroxyphosphoribosylaminopyrimidine deaminase/5-amino-6-(5-phosphoribosylamino)uracil reductase